MSVILTRGPYVIFAITSSSASPDAVGLMHKLWSNIKVNPHIGVHQFSLISYFIVRAKCTRNIFQQNLIVLGKE